MDPKTLEYFNAGLRSAAMEGWQPSPEMQKLIDRVKSGEIDFDQFKQMAIAKYTKQK